MTFLFRAPARVVYCVTRINDLLLESLHHDMKILTHGVETKTEECVWALKNKSENGRTGEIRTPDLHTPSVAR